MAFPCRPCQTGAPVWSRPRAGVYVGPWLADCNPKQSRLGNTAEYLSTHRLETLETIDDVPRNHGRHHSPVKLPSAERGVLGFRGGLFGVIRPALGRVKNGDVGMGAGCQRSPPPQAEQLRGIRREQLHDAAQRDALLPVQPRDRESKRGLKPSDSERCLVE